MAAEKPGELDRRKSRSTTTGPVELTTKADESTGAGRVKAKLIPGFTIKLPRPEMAAKPRLAVANTLALTGIEPVFWIWSTSSPGVG